MIYTILCDGINIYDASPSSGLLNPTLELSVNEPGTLSFSVLPTHNQYDNILPFTSNIEVYEDEELIFFGRVLDVTKDFLNRKNITCEGALGFLYDSVQEPIIFKEPDEEEDPPSTQPTTIRQFFSYLISEHNKFVDVDRQFTVGTVNITDAEISRELNYEKTMDAIKQLCVDAFGGYLFTRRVNGVNYIDWLRDFSAISNQPIQYAVNLTDLSQDFKGSDLVTSIVPIGDNDLDVSGKDETTQEYYNKTNPGQPYIDSDAVDTYGRILEKVNFDGITDPEVLYEKAVEWMANKQFDALSIDVSSADLSYLDSNYGVYKLGQLVHVYSNPHLIDTSLPIMKLSFKLDSPSKSITIGTPPRQDLSEIAVGSSGSGGGTNVSDVRRISGQVVDEKTPGIIEKDVPGIIAEEVPGIVDDIIEDTVPGMISSAVPDLVQYTKTLAGGVKIGSIRVGTSSDDIFTNTLYGFSDPSNNLGVDGNMYVQFAHVRTEYIRTNYSQFGLTLSNWNYDMSDKFEFTYRNNDNPEAINEWPHMMDARDTSRQYLFIQFNLWSSRTVVNFIYNGYYSGDSNVSFNSAFDYVNYYTIGADGGSFYIKKGADLEHIDTVAATWTRPTVTGTCSTPVTLYCSTPGGSPAPMDQSLYGIKVWNSNGELIHDYIPTLDGLFDVVDGTEYLTSTTGHINGPAIGSESGQVAAIWFKDQGTWKKNTFGVDGEDIPELVTVTQAQYDALSPAVKMDLTKAFFITDAVPTNNYLIPNPPYTPTESLETVEINGLVYDIPGDIEPNPEDEPTDLLTTLKIEDTVYELAGSGGGSSGYNSNVVHYTDTITTSQYGWISPVLDKDGNPLSSDDDLLLSIDVANSSGQYYKFEFLPYPNGSSNGWVAHLMNGNSNEVVASSVQLTVTISYIKDFYKNGILSEATLSPVIYSSEEREIGVWTDGKPLYQKTLYKATVSGQNDSMLIGVADVDHIHIDPSGSGVNDNTPIPYVNYNDNLLIGVFFEKAQADTTMQIRVGSAMSGSVSNLYVTVRYTKTTDVAGSGKYTTLGVPAVHYTNTEQVIGTWIDGKPLYQKTFTFTNTVSSFIDYVDCQTVADMNVCTKIEFVAKRGTGGSELYYHGLGSSKGEANSNYGICFRQQAGNHIYYYIGSYGTEINDITVTIQYTKTTD